MQHKFLIIAQTLEKVFHKKLLYLHHLILNLHILIQTRLHYEDNLLIIKIISDFMDISNKDLSFKKVYDLVDNNLNNINRLLTAFRNN